jgi:hypothetical protein
MTTNHEDPPHRSLKVTLEQVMAELARRGMVALKHGAFTGTLALGGIAMATTLAGSLLAPAKALAAVNEGTDWAQDEGVRDEGKVHYYQQSWSHVETTGQTCGERGCYGGTTTTTIFVKLRVQPQWGANLDDKRVGVVYRDVNGTQGTALGYYFTTHGDGYEEWHVPVHLNGYHHFVAFNGWYQDGTGSNPTWYDDNQGELHLVTTNNSAYQMVRQIHFESDVMVDDLGIHGSIVLDVADIDYDKGIRLVYTTDDWATVQELVIGPATLNAWHWDGDTWGNRERWVIELELPGSFDHIEYAIAYRHGVVTGADAYEYWDNNYGQNYRVEASP